MRATNAPIPVGASPPGVTGRSVTVEFPATYTFPDPSSAMACPEVDRKLRKQLLPPLQPTRSPPINAGNRKRSPDPRILHTKAGPWPRGPKGGLAVGRPGVDIKSDE